MELSKRISILTKSKGPADSAVPKKQAPILGLTMRIYLQMRIDADIHIIRHM